MKKRENRRAYKERSQNSSLRTPIQTEFVGCDAIRKTMRRQGQGGTAHLEYFLVAIAMTIAALWLLPAASTIMGAFNATEQMNQIAGAVPIP